MDPVTTELEAAVTKNTEVIGSAVVLINGIAKRIEDAKTDPQKLRDLTASLRTDATTLATAVAANTPAANPDPNADPNVGPGEAGRRGR